MDQVDVEKRGWGQDFLDPIYIVEEVINSFDKITNQHLLFHRSTTIKFPDNIRNQLTMIEVSVPYGDLKKLNDETISSLYYCMNTKTQKYQTLCDDLIDKTQLNIKFYPIIISALGAIPKKIFNNIKALLNNDSKQTKKCARSLSHNAIRGSALIYWNMSNHKHKENNLIIGSNENLNINPELIQQNPAV